LLDIREIRKNPDEVLNQLQRRSGDWEISSLLDADSVRRNLSHEVESRVAEIRKRSKKIGELKRKQEDGEELNELLAKNEKLSQEVKIHENKLKEAEILHNNALMNLPNLPHSSVPDGNSADDNQFIREHGKKPDFSFTPKSHDEIGNILGIFDLERASKIAGSRFALYKGNGAQLERALINFMLDIHTNENNYTEWITPFMVNKKSMTGTGQLPKFEEDLFKVENTDYYLIPTAEVPLTNIHREEVLTNETLPLKYTAYTPCFRSEAGSYGQDTKGLIRQHQFNKVELVKLCHPENSYEELEKLTLDAEGILKKLNLHYRVMNLCAGDLGFSAAKTYDLEVWLPSQNTYREISSCSNFEDFQSRRSQIRYKPEQNSKPEFVHTINGSGLAVGRTLVAILENYQNEDGSVSIPEALLPYMGKTKKITA
tara:strand:- start:6722 stop:8005 length:1284 start_codon:yes stop_codon:yes gene_type:complete